MFLLRRTPSSAIHAVILVARGGGFATVDEIARGTGINARALVPILAMLSRAGVLDGRRGRDGGYRLAKPAREITLLDVVEAVRRPVRAKRRGRSADPKLERQVSNVLGQAAKTVHDSLRNVRIADLLG